MTAISAAYRHSRFTGAPDRLTATEIWAVAHAVRAQLAEDRFERRLALDVAVDRLSRLDINEVVFEAAWDIDHHVVSPAGKQVLGVTEYDRASPDCVLVSVNGPMLKNQDTLMRSTIAHELGHVVFDAPGWILIPPAKPAYSGGGKNDPREVRANEFMGALLVPPVLARIDLQRHVKRHKFAPSPRPSMVVSGAPAYDAACLDSDAVDEVIFGLAERYGVSESLMRVRLDRYDLLRTGRPWQSH